MPTDLQRLFLTRDEVEVRFGDLVIREGEEQVHDTISVAIANLKVEFDAFKAELVEDFNTLVDKMQSFAKANDLVDENSGPLDEYLESFKRY